jgi:hypothetical protein
VAGRRRVDDDELILTLRDGIGKGAKDGDLLRARRTQIFFEQRATFRIEPLSGRREDLLTVARVSTAGSIRVTRSVAGRSRAAASTWAAGSVVVRVTWWPARASSVAMRTASVVLPTPPLPIVITTPLPRAAICSTS